MTLHLDQATTPARSVRTSPSPSTLKLAPVTPLIGAEVTGVDLRDPLHADTIVQLRAALLERKVLIFRDQPIDAEQQVRRCTRSSRSIPERSFGHSRRLA